MLPGCHSRSHRPPHVRVRWGISPDRSHISHPGRLPGTVWALLEIHDITLVLVRGMRTRSPLRILLQLLFIYSRSMSRRRLLLRTIRSMVFEPLSTTRTSLHHHPICMLVVLRPTFQLIEMMAFRHLPMASAKNLYTKIIQSEEFNTKNLCAQWNTWMQ